MMEQPRLPGNVHRTDLIKYTMMYLGVRDQLSLHRRAQLCLWARRGQGAPP